MQYYPPTCVYPTTPLFPYNNFAVPPPVACPGPQVIGEGDVTSVALPDGGVQLYFVPRRPPHAPWGGPEAWFIRTIPIPFPTCQTTLFSQQAQRVTSDQSFNHMEMQNKPNYEVKFHNDCASSTSDIHCFYPSLRCHNWFPKESVSTQAEHPRPAPAPAPAPVVCSNPCLCSHSITTKPSKTHKNHKCACMEVEAEYTCARHKSKSDQRNDCPSNNSSSMSVEDNKTRKKSKNKKDSKKSEKCSVKCECPPPKHDKGSATVTEQATSVEVGRETQATCGPGVPLRRVASVLVNDAEVEFWYPKTPYSKKQLNSAESKASCDCDSANASDSESSQHN